MTQSDGLSPLWSREQLTMDAWSQMDWFIQLVTAKDFVVMQVWEQLKWKEEFAAMYLRGGSPLIPLPVDNRRYSPYPKSAESDAPLATYLPTLEHMQEAKDVIARHLTNFADGKGTSLGPFTINLVVSFHHVHDAYGRQDVPRHLIYRGETTEPAPNPYQTRLLRHMASLLEMYCDHVRRCLYKNCKKIFLQNRRHQEYCDRRCQSVDVMQRRRAEEKQKSQASRKGTKQKGARHGTKRR